MTDEGRSSTLRQWAYRRDGGMCASCGCDTELTHEVFQHALANLRNVAGIRALSQWRKLVAMAGFDPRRKTWWEADHIHPLCEGGADTLENLRTLCLPCHRRETARLQKRVAKFKRLRSKRPPPKYQRYHLYRLSQ